ncbi:MAG: hypothetical protein FJ102_20900 [Deltaproteobacteria bacterium]|nr:hypothetical protein [Deltaproteobacteria bacterium]
MSILLVLLGGCGWWEARKACEASREAETAAWAALDAALVGATEEAAKASDAGAEAAKGIDSALSSAVEGAPPTQPYNMAEMAQEAYSRASRLGADAKEAEEQARWADYTLRTETVAADADRLAERATREVERLRAWREAYAQAAVALVMSAAHYQLAILPADSESWPAMPLSMASAGELPEPNPEEPAQQAGREAVESRREVLKERRDQFSRVIEGADRLAFDTERASQIAVTRARDIDYLDLPTSAQVARAAAMQAIAAGGRASEAAAKLKAAAAENRALYEGGDPPVPGPVEVARNGALDASKKVAELCQ